MGKIMLGFVGKLQRVKPQLLPNEGHTHTQIEKIEVKQGSGIQLNDDQFNKLSKKPDVLAGLQLLMNSHP